MKYRSKIGYEFTRSKPKLTENNRRIRKKLFSTKIEVMIFSSGCSQLQNMYLSSILVILLFASQNKGKIVTRAVIKSDF